MNDTRVDASASIPYFVHEGILSRCERIIKKLVIALIITIVLIFASNALWLYCWMQYDYADTESTESVDVDGGLNGVANYVGNDGDITNGEN